LPAHDPARLFFTSIPVQQKKNVTNTVKSKKKVEDVSESAHPGEVKG
jgi:hypothetical protein